MGFPLSRFSMLSMMTEEHNMQQIEQRFRLTAIVLNHPSDSVFKRHLSANFQRYDANSGSSFLFISFVNPPRDWRVGWEFDTAGVDALITARGVEDDLMLSAFCQRLDISESSLPKILVTTSLRASQFMLLSTSADTIGQQLQELGQFCDASSEAVSLDDTHLRQCVQQWSRSVSVHSTDQSLLDVLMDLYALDEINNPRSFYQDEARSRVRNICRKFRERIGDLFAKDKPNDDYMLTYQALCAKKLGDHHNMLRDEAYYSERHGGLLGGPMAMMTMNDYHALRHLTTPSSYLIARSQCNGCEEASLSAISQYNVLVHQVYGDSSLPDEYCFTPLNENSLGNAVGKFVENEMNTSVIQQIRAAKGIDMPEYYCRWKCGMRAKIVVENNHEINLNAYEHGTDEWQHLSIGEIYAAYRATRNNSQYAGVHDFGQEFEHLLWDIMQYRHDDCHFRQRGQPTSPLSTDFHQFLSRYFPQLVMIKQQLAQ